jgi:ferritin-like protein
MSSEGYHEPIELIAAETKELHRAIVSLIEELEAIDWYTQRADACTDADLRAVLLHHRDEEVEHAMMNLEWLRRRSPVFERNARTYLFSEGPIVEVEAQAEAAAAAGTTTTRPAPGSLGIGSLRRPR